MSPTHRATALLALLLLAGCGGGNSSTTTGGSSSGSGAHNFSGGGSNVVTLTVGNGPSGPDVQSTFNIPYVNVTICDPSSNSCATIDNVLVDTGSTGFRVLKSQLSAVSLAPLTDPNNMSNTIAECLPFADGYAWGSVALATVKVGGETASSVPIQVIDDSANPSPAVPSGCASSGMALNSVNAFDANGVLGVGLFMQDCGSSCEKDPSNDVYYSCAPAGMCASAALAPQYQVSNPVSGFGKDNNGVILQLPSISAMGAVGASGYLVFGIGTESNNALGGAGIYTVDTLGDFNTTFGGSALTAFIDSGSNALFFPDNSIPLCQQSSSFFCPTSLLSLSATNTGDSGTTGTVSFQVANLDSISTNDFAINDAAGPSTNIPGIGTQFFDWGLPFFYGNTVFVAIEGNVAAGTDGPYFAY